METTANPAPESVPARWTRYAYAVLLLLIGLVLLGGGAMLAWLGGSPYYVVAGLLAALSGALIWQRNRRGLWLYGALLAGTVAWAVWEVGFDPWLLMPRLLTPFVLGFGLLLPPVRRIAGHAPVLSFFGGWPTFATALLVAVAAGVGLHAAGPEEAVHPLWRTGAAVPAPARIAQPMAALPGGEWPHYGNDAGGTRFSLLDQITPANVANLRVAWEADTGPVQPGPTGGLEVTPIMVGDALYACNGYNAVVSFDAETGRERWRYDMTGDDERTGKPCRGVSHFRVAGATGACAERIFAVSQANDLLALDAVTGRPCADFGQGGRVSLLEGMGQVPFGIYYVSSAPQLVRGRVVVGGGIIDGQSWGDPSGVIRAYDAVTGQLSWAFDVGRPGQRGAPPPGETYTLSTPNSWAPPSADEALGLVYLPIGNATPDGFGGHRRPFDDQISSSVIALDAATGDLRWRFQTVHHDLWDYDVPAQPTLVDLPTPQGVRRALIQPTKRGEIFVLDRETGEPIKPVQELPTPQGGIVTGERLSPTQPFSTGMPAFTGPTMRESEMWGTTPIDQMLCRIRFRQANYAGTLTPLALGRTTIMDPGYGGGVNWGSVSVDADRGLLLANWMRLPTQQRLTTTGGGHASLTSHLALCA
jgi:quinoprotein glucose dehydrogenase